MQKNYEKLTHFVCYFRSILAWRKKLKSVLKAEEKAAEVEGEEGSDDESAEEEGEGVVEEEDEEEDDDEDEETKVQKQIADLRETELKDLKKKRKKVRSRLC